MSPDDRDVVRRFQRGEAGSFEALFRAYGQRVYSFCFRLCGNSADAEDLTQEVFLAAYQGLHRFEGRSKLATWLYRIALFRWRQVFGVPRPETVPLENRLEGAATAPDPALASVERLSFDEALSTLSPSLREAFLLVKVEGLRYREAAAVLAIPQGTVQSRVHDASVRLRALLTESGADCSAIASPNCPATEPCR